MSISVSDCLNIGILKNAALVAGKKGLQKTVENVTILEFDGFEVEPLGSGVMKHNEMALSAFYAFKDCPDRLPSVVKNIIATGVSCIVVFYLRDILKELPKEVLQICDSLDIPLIVLPTDGLHYAYSDVIMPIAEAITQERKGNTMFVSDTLQQFLDLPESHQSIHSLLSLLRDKTDADLLLLDMEMRPLDWMLTDCYEPGEILRYACPILSSRVFINPTSIFLNQLSPAIQIKVLPIRSQQPIGILLAIKKQGETYNVDALTQATEVLKLFLQIWRTRRSQLNELDILLQGGKPSGWSDHIVRLSVIRNKNGTSFDYFAKDFSLLNVLEEYTQADGKNTYAITYFDGSIVIAETEKVISLSEVMVRIKRLLNIPDNLSAAQYEIQPGEEIKKAYAVLSKGLTITHKLFPFTTIIERKQIIFSKEIVDLKHQLGTQTDPLCGLLSPLLFDSHSSKYIDTLKTVYFQCEGNITKASQVLNIHLNTLKYRMKTIGNLLGMDLASPLASSQLVMALAVSSLDE